MAAILMMKTLFFLFILAVSAPSWADEPVADAMAEAVAVPSADAIERDRIISLWDSGNHKEAVRDTKKWQERDKKSGEPLVLLARFSFEQKKYNRALSYGQKALERSPQHADAYYWRGRAFEAKKELLDAANEFRAAMLAEPDHASAAESLQRVMGSLQTPEDARGISSKSVDKY